MKSILKSVAYLFVIFGIAITGQAQDHATKHHQDHKSHFMVNQDKLQWADAPPSLPAGAKLAVLDGDPTKEGPFTIRLIFPANFKIPPHWHPTAEHITVIEGGFYMGTTEKIDMNNATLLKPGGFAVMPAKTVHYGFTKDKTVVQVHGKGPFQITYVNKADDPRNKEKMR